jgi:hypothetical protein
MPLHSPHNHNNGLWCAESTTAMIYHLVLFKFKPNLSSDEFGLFVAGVERLKNINGVISTQCGRISTSFYPNFLDRTKGYTHSLLVTLKDAQSLEQYDKCELHEEVKQKCILPFLDKTQDSPVMAVDYFGELSEEIVEKKCMSNNCLNKSTTWMAALGLIVVAGFGFARYHSRL